MVCAKDSLLRRLRDSKKTEWGATKRRGCEGGEDGKGTGLLQGAVGPMACPDGWNWTAKVKSCRDGGMWEDRKHLGAWAGSFIMMGMHPEVYIRGGARRGQER